MNGHFSESLRILRRDFKKQILQDCKKGPKKCGTYSECSKCRINVFKKER